MEKKITPFLSIGFVNANGNKFSVQYGYEENDRIPMCRVTGPHIPIPVFAGTWFRGVPESQMERSLSEIGYAKYARVNLLRGTIQVFDVPETETKKPVSDDCIESAAQAIKDAWEKGYSGLAYRLYNVYAAVGGTETMKNLLSGVEFGCVTETRYDEEYLVPEEFDAIADAIRLADRMGKADLASKLFDLYVSNKKTEIKTQDEILNEAKLPEEMSIDSLNRISGLRRATENMLSVEDGKPHAVMMVHNWAGCSLSSAMKFVNDVKSKD